jgi:hypothetical protein
MKTYKLFKLHIPTTWEDVSAFCDWYLKNGLPLVFPKGAEVFMSDDATSTCLFRHGQFQVELYLIHPKPLVQFHEHPGVDVIKVRLAEESDNSYVAYVSPVLRKGQSHGAGVRFENEETGFPLLAIQHWKSGIPTTVAAAWKGKTVGPLQEKLIKRIYPEALVIDGYADVTKTMGYLEELKNVANG